jgi:CTP synthase (UTP-ammonia lyase)
LLSPPPQIKICLVGKYTSLNDAYLSVIKSLQHASLKVGRKLVLEVGPIATCPCASHRFAFLSHISPLPYFVSHI